MDFVHLDFRFFTFGRRNKRRSPTVDFCALHCCGNRRRNQNETFNSVSMDDGVCVSRRIRSISPWTRSLAFEGFALDRLQALINFGFKRAKKTDIFGVDCGLRHDDLINISLSVTTAYFIFYCLWKLNELMHRSMTQPTNPPISTEKARECFSEIENQFLLTIFPSPLIARLFTSEDEISISIMGPARDVYKHAISLSHR